MKIFQIDSFTDKPFSGNPAAVCILKKWQSEAWMQAVAAEMNLSETAFLVPDEKDFELRWFTPELEVDLCGHATLASAHVLWRTGQLAKSETARFHTKSGLLAAKLQGDLIELDFPAIRTQETTLPAGLADALGVAPISVAQFQSDYLIEITSEEELRELAPDFAALANLPIRSVVVTSVSTDYDFVSRFFAPALGIDEDPVTGAAHCCLGPFWSERLGKTQFRALQASQRGGKVGVRLESDRVYLQGRAVTIFEAELLV